MTTQTIFTKTVSSPADGTENFIGLSRNERWQLNSYGFNLCNHLIAINRSDQDLTLRFNHDAQDVIPLLARTGRVVISAEDNKFFDSVELLNDSGSAATGDITVTYGVLPR